MNSLYSSLLSSSITALSPSASVHCPTNIQVILTLSGNPLIHSGFFKNAPLNIFLFIGIYNPCVSLTNASASLTSIPARTSASLNVEYVLGRSTISLSENDGSPSVNINILVLFSITTISSA